MTLRMGVLGAARITPPAVTEPAKLVEGVEVVAVGARDPERAKAFASEQGIGRVVADYAKLVTDPDVDAVYNALPPSGHAEWTIAALEAGKHVLCEKPFAQNATEAAAMVAAARASGCVLVEAFHWRYHPLALRMLELVPRLGTVTRLDGTFCVSIPDRTDLRWQYALGGGALMDLGCYPTHWMRTVAGAAGLGEPAVTSASAVEGAPRIDESLTGQLAWAGGATGTVTCGMGDDAQLTASLTVVGSGGTLHVENPLAPQYGSRLTFTPAGGEAESEGTSTSSTYEHQLRAFVAACAGTPVPTGGADAIANMAIVDALYTAAGFPVRGAA